VSADHDGEVQYGGERFIRASHTLRQLRTRASLATRVKVVTSDPRGALELAHVLWRLPRIRVRTTDSAAGRALRSYLGQRHRGIPWNRIAHGVLPLPPTPEEYLSGRSRQALRTNLRRAEQLGISCRRVSSAEKREQVERWLAARFPSDDPDATPDRWIGGPPGEAEWWIASDDGDTPLAIAAVSFDSDWVLLHTMVSRSHPARWLLHTELVREAIGRGARYVCVDADNALQLDPGVQYFQRLLGYQVINLRLSHEGRPR
jgi:hypothetical protein